MVKCTALKNDAEKWPLVMTLLSQSSSPAEEQFFCLQLLQDHVHLMTRHVELREALMNLIRGRLGAGLDLGPTFLLNKLAALLGDIILLDFPHGWPEAFNELLGLSSKYPVASDLFLRISLHLNEAFDPRHAQKGPAELARDHRVKDAMRASAVSAIVALLQQLLMRPESSSLSLRALAGYADWIDVALVAEPGLLGRVYSFLQPNSPCRIDALACIRAIVGKGMPSADRVQLAEYLSLYSLIAPPSCTMDDTELEVETVRLLATYGQSLAHVDPLGKVEVDALNALLPILLAWLRVVSEDGLAELTSLLPHLPLLFQMTSSKENAALLLAALIPRLGGEDEETRNRMLPVFDSLCLFLSSTATAAIRDHVLAVKEGEEELALFLVQRYGEALKGQPCICITVHDAGGQSRQQLTAFGQMLHAVLAMRLPPALLLTRLEIITRYASIIEASGQFDLSMIMGLFAQALPLALRATELLGRWAMRTFKDKGPELARQYAQPLGQLVSMLRVEETKGVFDRDGTVCRWEVLGQLLGLMGDESSMVAAMTWIGGGYLAADQSMYAMGSLLKGHADAGASITPQLHRQAVEMVKRGNVGQLFALQRLVALPSFTEVSLLEPVISLLMMPRGGEDEAEAEALTIVNMAAFRLRPQIPALLLPKLSHLLQRLVERCQAPASGTDEAIQRHEMRSKTIAFITTLVTGGQAELIQAHAVAIQGSLLALMKPVDWPLDKAILSTTTRILRDRIFPNPEILLSIASAALNLILVHEPKDPAIQPVLVEFSHLLSHFDAAQLGASLGMAPEVIQALLPILAMNDLKQRRGALVDFFTQLRRHLGII